MRKELSLNSEEDNAQSKPKYRTVSHKWSTHCSSLEDPPIMFRLHWLEIANPAPIPSSFLQKTLPPSHALRETGTSHLTLNSTNNFCHKVIVGQWSSKRSELSAAYLPLNLCYVSLRTLDTITIPRLCSTCVLFLPSTFSAYSKQFPASKPQREPKFVTFELSNYSSKPSIFLF